MNKRILQLTIVVFLLISSILIIGCSKQTEKAAEGKTIIKPNITTEEVVSELQDVKTSMNQLGKTFEKK